MAQGSVLDHFIEESVKSQIISVVPAVSKRFPHYLHMLIKKCKVQTLWPVCSNTVVNCEDVIELPLHPKPFLFDLDPEVKMTIKIEKL